MTDTPITIEERLETLETFIKRRFCEISMEINATSQQVDMAEDGITKSFADILKVLATISYTGTGASAANSGAELEAVVDVTEQATTKILNAAERIEKNLGKDIDAQTQQDLQDIVMACEFQDITGQRIQNALKNIRDIEAQLNALFSDLGIDIAPAEEEIMEDLGGTSSQDDIDALID